MTAHTILVIDDEPRVRTLLRNVLEDNGFGVVEAENENMAMRILASTHVSLVTLDLDLGKANGVDLAQKIRRYSQVPIIMVTGKDDVIDRVVGLEVGADDYITKPFHVREVIARIRSVLRRAKTPEAMHNTDAVDDQIEDPKSSVHFCFDGMTAIPDRMELIDRNNNECGLTGGDFKLLSVFLERPKRVLSRSQLMDLVGGIEWAPLDRTIDNKIARLRKKIERDPSNPKLIKTVRGVGYTLACNVETVQSSRSSSKTA